MSKIFENSPQVNDNRTLSVERMYGEPRLLISGERRIGFLTAASDAPALALAILEAAGHAGSSSSSCLMQAFDLIEQHIKEESKKAEEAAALEKLTKRRNELASEFSPPRSTAEYRNLSGTSQRAIDRVIELEDKAQSNGG